MISIAVIMAVSNYLLFKLVFDDDFDNRFARFQSSYRSKMVRENQEFVRTMKDIIELDPEAIELVGFGEKWRQRLESIDALKMERDNLEQFVPNVYFVLISSIVFSGAGLMWPNGIHLPFNIVFFVTSIGWWLTLGGLLVIFWILLQHFIIEMKMIIPESTIDLAPKQGAISNGAFMSKIRQQLSGFLKRVQ